MVQFYRDGNALATNSRLQSPTGSSRDMDNQSDSSNTTIYGSVVSFSSNLMPSAAVPSGAVNQDAASLASVSHSSSDSMENSAGRTNFSPKSSVNGGSHIVRQDSADSHASATSSAGPVDDLNRSNPSSFNSRASGSSIPPQWPEPTSQTAPHGHSGLQLRTSGSTKELLEAAEETIDELRDEARMWERHAQKLKIELEKLKRDCSFKSKQQAEADMELSAANNERDSLKSEVDQLRLSVTELKRILGDKENCNTENMMRAQRQLEDELMFLRESNGTLTMQLNKSQEANVELVSILEELEETVEKQRLELANLSQISSISENGAETGNQTVMDAEVEESPQKEQNDAPNSMEMVLNQLNSDLIQEIEVLKAKLEELERDCTELTEENLELIYKLKELEKNVKEVKESGSNINQLQYQISFPEEQLHRKDLNGIIITESTLEMDDLKKKCAELEIELQNFKKNSIITTDFRTIDDDAFKEHQKNDLVEELKLRNAKLEAEFLLKEKEIDTLETSMKELEDVISRIKREKIEVEETLAVAQRENIISSKCLDDVRNEMIILSGNMDTHLSVKKMFERKSSELEIRNQEQDLLVSQLEADNLQLSERISGLEAKLRYMRDEKETRRLEIEDYMSQIVDLKDEIAQERAEMEILKVEHKKMLQDAQKRLVEAQEESEVLKRSHSKLESTVESLTEECSLLKKQSEDLRRQKMEMHEQICRLEVVLRDLREQISGNLNKVVVLEEKLSLLHSDFTLKQESLVSQLESMLQESKDQEQKINKANVMLKQINYEQMVEVENLKQEICHLSTQVCSSQDEREKLSADAVREVSILRSNKNKLENDLHEVQSKVTLYETELHNLTRESNDKIVELVNSLNASKLNEEMLMNDVERMQRMAESFKSSEETFKRMVNELELELKASDYEKQQINEVVSGLKLQHQKVTQFQNEILNLKSSLEEEKCEREKLEGLLHSVSEECEELKAEKISFSEKISVLQKALLAQREEERLEEKVSIKVENEPNGNMERPQAQTKAALESKIQSLQTELAEALEANNSYQMQINGLLSEKRSNRKEENCNYSDDGGIAAKADQSNKISSLETELKEMRERYLHMSLQYAEVEAQREELVMQLKSVKKEKKWFS
ncbi:major antigen-like isoform X2 [Phalaenopsis equestris]|uniref:major antigen-like isoform X2 n=1 Tax=Phalaenopsis equestris TaxID=78828 RepID=UPI0009E4B535|nr:major antigen-like isoform X2 [Phalaenopsis equestris]